MKSKMLLLLLVLLCGTLGAVFGMAKMGILPANKWASQHTALGSIARICGFKPAKAGPKASSATSPAITSQQLAQQQRTLQAEEQAFQQERAAWEHQKQRALQTALQAPKPPTLDPTQIARLAEIYSKMDGDKANAILNKLPESEVVLLLQQMDERKVATVLENMNPVKAARITGELAHAPSQTGGPTPIAANSASSNL